MKAGKIINFPIGRSRLFLHLTGRIDRIRIINMIITEELYKPAW